MVSKEKGRSTLDLFLEYFGLEAEERSEEGAKVVVDRKKGTNGYSTVTAKLIGPNREAIAAISTEPNAIAYVSVGTAQEVASKGGRVKLLDLDGVPATVAHMANETYPSRRPLHVVTKGQPEGILKEFIDFLTGEEGQTIVSSLEVIPVK